MCKIHKHIAHFYMAANANMHTIYMCNTPHTHFRHFFYAE